MNVASVLVKVEILNQGFANSLSAPELTLDGPSWTDFGTIDVGQVRVIDEPANAPWGSFVVLDGDIRPDTWLIKKRPDLGDRFDPDDPPLVELSNLASPEFVVSINVTPALAMYMDRGMAVTGVANEIQNNRRVILQDSGRLFSHEINFEPRESLTTKLRGPVMVPVMRLHCPKHEGCVANEEYAVESGNTVEAQITFFVAGLNLEMSTLIQCSSQWETTNGECLQYLLPAELSTEWGTIGIDGRRNEANQVVGLPIIHFVEGGEGRQEAIPEIDDGCQLPADTIESDRRLGRPELISAGSRKYSFKAVRTARGKMRLGISAPGWPSFSFQYERTAATSFERSSKLVAGAFYLSYTADAPANLDLPEHAEILWTTL